MLILYLFTDRNFAEQTLGRPAHLVDVTIIPNEDLKKHNAVGLLEFVQKHVRDPDISLIIQELTQFITNACNYLGSNESLLYIESTLYYIMQVGNVKNLHELIKQLEAIPVVGEKVMGSIARKFEEEGLAKGKAAGLAEGKKKMAVSMLAEGLDINLISKITKLTINEINDLKTQQHSN